MPPIRSSNDADQTLLRIGRLQRDIQAEKILLDDGIENLKKMSLQKVAPLCEEREATEEVLLEYIKANKSEIASGPTKSIVLTYGTIGVRDSQSVPVRAPGYTDEQIAKSLIARGFVDCAKIEYKWIKNAVKGIDILLHPRLERIGIHFTRVKKNVPFYTIDEAKISDNAPSPSSKGRDGVGS